MVSAVCCRSSVMHLLRYLDYFKLRDFPKNTLTHDTLLLALKAISHSLALSLQLSPKSDAIRYRVV